MNMPVKAQRRVIFLDDPANRRAPGAGHDDLPPVCDRLERGVQFGRLIDGAVDGRHMRV